MKLTKRQLIAGIIFFISFDVKANISKDLDGFFRDMGYGSNVTSPAAFQSQAAGFFGGGSLYARNQVRQYQLVQLDLPSYRAGCGGIDLFTGSFSFISSQKLVDLGKKIMTNGGAYAVDLALATTVPELKQTKDFLQNTAQKVNHASVTSCEMAQNLVGGIWPKTTASQQKICKDQALMGQSGLFSDYADARMGCSGNKFNKAIDEANKDPVIKKQVVLNKNLVWSILKSKSALSQDQELAEMVMSLTGTLIFNKEGKVTNVPSLAGNADLINALVGQGTSTAKIWQCVEKELCLEVKLNNVTITPSSTLTHQVRKLISSINEKLLSDTKPTSSEVSFIGMTSLPVMKFLSVLNSTHYGHTAVDIEEYSSLIAFDLLSNYLQELLTEINNATAGSEIPEDLIKDIRNRIHTASSKIAELDPKVGRKLKEKLALVQYMEKIEKQVASQLGSSVS